MSTTVNGPTAQELRDEVGESTRFVFSGNEWMLIGEPVGGGTLSTQARAQEMDTPRERG